MIKLRSIFILSLALQLASTWQVAGQDVMVSDSLTIAGQDSSVVMPVTDLITQDSLPKKSLLSGVELKIDYGKLMTLWTAFESKYEGAVHVRFLERIVLVTEFGYAELNPLKAYDNALYYTVTGTYGRVGLDYYTAYNPGNFYYAGLRYATSNFKDEGMFLIESEYWEDYTEGFGSDNISAAWIELVIGTETYLKIGKQGKLKSTSPLLWGWSARLRILTDFVNREEPRIYSIPGYGRTFNDITPALNFYVKYRLGS